jgi:hypothetical protein
VKLERVISVFDKSSDEFIIEINVDHLELDFIKRLFGNSTIDDPNNYKPFKINKFQFEKLSETIEVIKKYPLSKFELFIEAYQNND